MTFVQQPPVWIVYISVSQPTGREIFQTGRGYMGSSIVGRIFFSSKIQGLISLTERSQTRGPRTFENSAVFYLYGICLFFQIFLVLAENLKSIFSLCSFRPVRPFFESHAARKSLRVWDPCNNVFTKAFTCTDTKSTKRQSSHQSVSFALLGSVWAKGAYKNVGEIDPWAQFHQRSTYSFYTRRSQKRKKILTTWLTLSLLGTTCVKSARKYVGEIDPWFRSNLGPETLVCIV